ncbi:MAG: hypothetical protein ACE361_22305 [Aureliella sp.]
MAWFSIGGNEIAKVSNYSESDNRHFVDTDRPEKYSAVRSTDLNCVGGYRIRIQIKVARSQHSSSAEALGDAEPRSTKTSAVQEPSRANLLHYASRAMLPEFN